MFLRTEGMILYLAIFLLESLGVRGHFCTVFSQQHHSKHFSSPALQEETLRVILLYQTITVSLRKGKQVDLLIK